MLSPCKHCVCVQRAQAISFAVWHMLFLITSELFLVCSSTTFFHTPPRKGLQGFHSTWKKKKLCEAMLVRRYISCCLFHLAVLTNTDTLLLQFFSTLWSLVFISSYAFFCTAICVLSFVNSIEKKNTTSTSRCIHSLLPCICMLVNKRGERKHFIEQSVWEGTLVRVSYDDLGDQPGPFNQGLPDLGRPVAEGIVPQLFGAKGAQDDWEGRE